jgi:hypothetical protein
MFVARVGELRTFRGLTADWSGYGSAGSLAFSLPSVNPKSQRRVAFRTDVSCG